MCQLMTHAHMCPRKIPHMWDSWHESFDDTYGVTHFTCVFMRQSCRYFRCNFRWHMLTCVNWWHMLTCVFRVRSHTCEIADMSHSMTTHGATHLTYVIECYSVTHADSLQVSFEGHVSIPRMCLSNPILLSSGKHMSQITFVTITRDNHMCDACACH